MSIEINDVIKFTPSKNSERTAVKRFGELWVVLCDPCSMYCFNGEIGVTIKSLNKVNGMRDLRNIKFHQIKED